jgi:hypothetical protein
MTWFSHFYLCICLCIAEIMDCVGSLNAWAETQREDVWCDESCSATQAEAPLISSLSEKSEVLYYLQGYGGGLNALERDAREKLLVRLFPSKRCDWSDDAAYSH